MDAFCHAVSPNKQKYNTISRFDMSCAQAHWVGSNRSTVLCY